MSHDHSCNPSQVGKSSDVRVVGCQVYLLPVRARIPLKFGNQTLTSVTCARVRLTVEDRSGSRGSGWGETPLSVQWAWPADLDYDLRLAAMQRFCRELAGAWVDFPPAGHPIEIGYDFLEGPMWSLLEQANAFVPAEQQMPYLAALVCASPFDIALHDAFGNLHQLPVYETYNARWMSRDLAAFLEPADDFPVLFDGKYPADFLLADPPGELPAWHLVGGLDPLGNGTGGSPPVEDGMPHYLTDWIDHDGLTCLKVKLRGTDASWDFERLASVGQIARGTSVKWLSADFNCTVTDPAYVNGVLDRLAAEDPDLFDKILYVEQPFPYDLPSHPIDVHSVSDRKLLLMDESAHDWRMVRLGKQLGWTGVALKTCKTQSGALLSLCWARAHGMQLMVQDLTNPMLAQIPHVLLAAHAGTIMGVETNAMQFYPEASRLEAQVHPGLYQRTKGKICLATIGGSGFGYRVDEIARPLPKPFADVGV